MIDKEVLFELMNKISRITRGEFDSLPEEFFNFVDTIERITLLNTISDKSVIIQKEEYESLLEYKKSYMDIISDSGEC